MGMNKVLPGQRRGRPSADSHNSMLDAARAYQESRHEVSPGPSRRPFLGVVGKVLNMSGDDWDQYAAVALDFVLIDPADSVAEFQRVPAFKGYTPSGSDVLDVPTRMGVVLGPLANGAVGDVQVSGLAPCKVNVLSVAHRYAELTSGSTVATSGRTGSAKILYAEAGTGEVWAWVHLGAGKDESAADARGVAFSGARVQMDELQSLAWVGPAGGETTLTAWAMTGSGASGVTIYDTDSYWSDSDPAYLAAPFDGWYQAEAQVNQFSGGSSGSGYVLRIRVAGSGEIVGEDLVRGGQMPRMLASGPCQLGAGDRLYCTFFHNVIDGMTVGGDYASGRIAFFSLTYLGPAKPPSDDADDPFGFITVF